MPSSPTRSATFATTTAGVRFRRQAWSRDSGRRCGLAGNCSKVKASRSAAKATAVTRTTTQGRGQPVSCSLVSEAPATWRQICCGSRHHVQPSLRPTRRQRSSCRMATCTWHRRSKRSSGPLLNATSSGARTITSRICTFPTAHRSFDVSPDSGPRRLIFSARTRGLQTALLNSSPSRPQALGPSPPAPSSRLVANLRLWWKTAFGEVPRRVRQMYICARRIGVGGGLGHASPAARLRRG
mmetsp:Transcript_20568/g.37113  ORF Transcript_20568/g.37113 Transcript_20568/m.37113 type:complete len:240 (-) Transcript_20568:62-781(-)